MALVRIISLVNAHVKRLYCNSIVYFQVYLRQAPQVSEEVSNQIAVIYNLSGPSKG
jgi:hypothetical protein